MILQNVALFYTYYPQATFRSSKNQDATVDKRALLVETFFRAEGLRSIKNRHVSYVSLQRARGAVWPVGNFRDPEN